MKGHRIDDDELARRLAASNRALELMRCPNEKYPVWLRFRGRRAFVCWQYHGEHSVQWVTSGNSFYPMWHRRRGPWGGTMSTAMSQLIYWCQGKPVLPLRSWEYWCGPTVALGQERGPDLIAHLRASGYPVEVTCVVCGEKPTGLDWWSLNGVAGPCCRHANGCLKGRGL